MVASEPIRQLEVLGPNAFRAGWYVLAYSDEVRAREIKTVQFLGREYIVWRSESGEVSVMEPHCPHLGAHMGHGGEVHGDTIRCPMHHFRFDASGQCVSSGYGCQAAPKNGARTLVAIDHAGFIFALHGDAAAPAMQPIPALDLPVGPVSQLQLETRSSAADVMRRARELAGHLECVGLFGAPDEGAIEVSVQIQEERLLIIDVAGSGVGDTRILVALTPVDASAAVLRARVSLRGASDVPALFPRQLARRLVTILAAHDQPARIVSSEPMRRSLQLA